MQLMINIDKDYYEIIKHDVKNGMDYLPCKLIANGVPLPKGHGKLIDADEAIRKLCGKSCGCTLEECGYDVPCFSVQRINSAQTIIEADKAESEG